MVKLLILALVFYFLAGRGGLPKNTRFSILAVAFIGILIVHSVLPDGHPIRMASGESRDPWMIFGSMALLALLYLFGLSKLRHLVEQPEIAQTKAVSLALGEAELDRYARHIVLREIGGPGQMQLKAARVLVIGAGGLGAPALQYLTGAGIGTIGIIDDDTVENVNLQRQIIHQDQAIGMPKVFSAQNMMIAQNPYVEVRPYNRRLTDEIAQELFAQYDIILEGSDNFGTRYLANATAVKLGVPLVSGALSQWEGQISVFDPKSKGPCYACVFPNAPSANLAPSCAEAGVFAPLPGVIGAMMAAEAMKIITGAGDVMHTYMLIYDALYAETRKIKTSRRLDCPVCKDQYNA
jgi:molybdopterin/thiamine biosynthesis adenylyltransferase